MSRSRWLDRLRRWDQHLARVETALVALILFATLIGSLAQIVLRNVAGSALPGFETAARRGVLWIALLGASLATRNRGHLAIDALPHLLPQRTGGVLTAAVAVIAAAVAGWLALGSVRFVSAEAAFGEPGVARAAVILPVGFTVIAIRFLFDAIQRIVGHCGGQPADPPVPGAD